MVAPVYNRAALLPAAIESLLGQTFRDFALVVVDDGSQDGTADVARRYAAADPRVTVLVNERRLGMLGNTRRALTLPHALHPGAQYTALASDHDVWEPGWLASLVAALDAAPDAVMAYPLSRRIDADGRPFAGTKPPWRFDTAGIRDPRERLRRASAGMVAGDMIYGLFRRAPLEQVGPTAPCSCPTGCCWPSSRLRGEFVQVPELLWSRRFRGLAELERQRRAFWPEGAPWYARRVPWWLVQVALFAHDYALGGKGAALGLGRRESAALAVTYLEVALRHLAWRRWARLRKAVLRLGHRVHPRRLASLTLAAAGRRARVALCGARTRAAAERAVAPTLARGARATGLRTVERAHGKLDQLLAETAERAPQRS